MAGSSRRYALAATLLPLLFLAMAGVSRAAIIHVNSLSSEPGFPLLCTLPDAIASHEGTANACVPGTGDDTIVFDLTGTIVVDEPLIIAGGSLDIQGPIFSGIVLDGGGTSQIIDHESGDLEINNLTFQNGFANSPLGMQGGAILANSSDDLEIENCTFFNNFAVTGGAIFAGPGTVIVVNSTFASNVADPMNSGSGGAIFNNAADLEITNCTFANNDAAIDGGGGLGWQSGSGPEVKNSIFESFSDDSDNCQAPGDVPDTSLTDGGFNISDDETCFTGATSSLINTPVNLDPDGLESNGGPTKTIEPDAGSPAIDFVPIADCVEFDDELVNVDQRTFGRPDPGETDFCDAGAFETGAVASLVISPTGERVQIARGSTPNTDQVNIGVTFTINNFGDDTLGCGFSEDALRAGFDLSLFEGTCTALPLNGLRLFLDPFVVHTVNHESYGTLFQSGGLQQSTEKVSARLIQLPKPPLPACGSWTLNLEVSGLNTSDTTTVNLPDGNPFALVLTDTDGDVAGCFDVTNAITGSQPPPPPPGGHRRRVRR